MEYLREISKTNDLCSFLKQPFNIPVIQAYAPITKAEAEVEQFCEDLQDLLELISKKDVLFTLWRLEWKSEKSTDT